ncbi:transmembrane protein 182 [Trichomycterus rosablanca]|uniref:transmembrane protein 182 n=1 Tax=Trichomycterus rosablanca TaxID=2290929 RepID=UPI002F35C975
MKLNVALFFAGLFGALATFFILLSFGTDYWLLATETCTTGNMLQDSAKGDPENSSIFYHEGFFWRCSFEGNMENDNMLKFWFTNQPRSKECTHAYLSPFPVSDKTHNATTYDSAIIYRGFWSVFMLLGVAAVVLAGFFIICAAPFTSHCLYKTGGALYILAGFFLILVIVLYVIWLHVMDVVGLYEDYKRNSCQNFQLNISYGLSFMFAPVGVFFCLLAGLLFLLIARTVRIHYK